MSRDIEMVDSTGAVVLHEDSMEFIPPVGLEDKLENGEAITISEFNLLMIMFLFGDSDFAKEKREEIIRHMEEN